MSLLDRLITLSLIDVNSALAKLENPEQVREAVLNEIGSVLESAGAELRQLQRDRDNLLKSRRVAETESDEKQAALNNAAETEKEALKKPLEALQEALTRLDEQIAEQNRQEAELHRYVARLQDIRRNAAEWSPRRKSEPVAQTTSSAQADTQAHETHSSAAASASSASTQAEPKQTQAQPKAESTPPKAASAQPKTEPAQPVEDASDPFVKMKRLKERMDSFQARTNINEEELRAFEAEKAIAEEETRHVIEENLREIKKKMNDK